MPATRFTGDPLTGAGTYYDENGNPFYGQLSDFFGNRFIVSGYTIFDRLNPGPPMSIGRQGAFTMTGLTAGRYQLVSEIDLSGANRAFGTHIEVDNNGIEHVVPNEFMRLSSGTASVTTDAGSVLQFEVANRPMARIGHQWLAREVGQDRYEYSTFPGPFSSNAEVRAAVGPQWRLATGEEAAYQGLYKALVAENSRLFEQFLAENQIQASENRSRESEGYWALLGLIDLSALRAFTSSIFKTP